jgi:uncharacterized protein
MQAPTLFAIAGQQFLLSPLKCLFWQQEQTLIVSDLHLGKTGHFRKHGLPVPNSVYITDLKTLFTAIQYFNPQQLIVVGDMFHSKANKELDLFSKWRNDIAHIEFHLVKGNHDILPTTWYTNNHIQLHQQQLLLQNICFVHDVPAALNPSHYYITGHMHPGVLVRNKTRQSLRFPCFYFNQQYAILPAFSAFTGLFLVNNKKADTVFAIANNGLLQL